MANIDIWIQLENRPWDTMPKGIDRLTNRTAKQVLGYDKNPIPAATDCDYDTTNGYYNVLLTVLRTGAQVPRRMYAPLLNGKKCPMDALIFRRYKAPDSTAGIGEWQVPDDRKVNPWDINEPDPTDTGTMGTIPGPVIECNLSTRDTVIVHFRNADFRPNKTAKETAHSMHVHGFVFKPQHDGAYPLSPADPAQPIPATEQAAWAQLNVHGSKIGDRVPAGGTFNYTWNTFGWASTAGVWLYHDHSFCDMDNISLGAIGIVVIHNTGDNQNDFILSNADFPDQNPNGSPIKLSCIRFPDLTLNMVPQRIGVIDPRFAEFLGHSLSSQSMGGMPMEGPKPKAKAAKQAKAAAKELQRAVGLDKRTIFDPDLTRVLQVGDSFLHLDDSLRRIIGWCSSIYKQPPTQAQYLQLYHRLTGSPGMNINGRTFLGNTPSVLAGIATKMRFGVVGMGNVMSMHTFHIHGHRWILPGPSGTTPIGIQGSPQNHPVSQFEDTRLFGPANSFVFTINGAAGSFMRAGGPSSLDSKGEWHMHCHVLDHMMDGMMGSLIIAEANDGVVLPVGEECVLTADTGGGMPGMGQTIIVKNFEFSPVVVSAAANTQITFDFQNTGHTVKTVSTTSANPITVTKNAGGDPANSSEAVPVGQRTVTVVGAVGGQIKLICGIHGGDPNTNPITQMAAIINITP